MDRVTKSRPTRTIEDVLLIINRQAKSALEKMERQNRYGRVVVSTEYLGSEEGPGKVRTEIVETEKPE